jgi:Zn-dependent peptidase ImmA (M78 family)
MNSFNQSPAQTKEYAVAANGILRRYWEGRSVPIDPFSICNKIGIQVLQTELPEDISGALIKEVGKDPMIVVHYADSRKRQRFTCAHELGHYIQRVSSGESLDAYDVVDLRSPLSREGTNASERFANNFAANLLMPFSEVSKRYKDGFTLIDLAATFDVSEEAMNYRLQYVKGKC